MSIQSDSELCECASTIQLQVHATAHGVPYSLLHSPVVCLHVSQQQPMTEQACMHRSKQRACIGAGKQRQVYCKASAAAWRVGTCLIWMCTQLASTLE
jgi:hypothetical protein